MTSLLQIDRDFNNTVGEWIWGPYQYARQSGRPLSEISQRWHNKEVPLNALVMNKYGIPVYRGIHIANNELIEATGFDGGF